MNSCIISFLFFWNTPLIVELENEMCVDQQNAYDPRILFTLLFTVLPHYLQQSQPCSACDYGCVASGHQCVCKVCFTRIGTVHREIWSINNIYWSPLGSTGTFSVGY